MALQTDYRREADHEPVARQPEPHQMRCNDVIFLLVWLALIGTTVYFAGAFGPEFIHATKVQGLGDQSGFQLIVKYIATSAFAAMGMSLVWIAVMICAGEFLIWIALFASVIACILAGYVLTKAAYNGGVKHYYWPAVLFGVIALLLLLFMCCIRKRVRFAAAHLKVAGSAILRLPMTLVVAVVMVLINAGWSVAWVVGTVGFMAKQKYIHPPQNCTIGDCDIQTAVGSVVGVLFVMLLIYFWGSYVLKKVIAVTVAGTVAAWKNASNSACMTLGAWLRAITLNLGSICFGSLIVAALEATRTILNIMASIASKSGDCVTSCIFSCISCVLRCIQRWIEFFNRFAFTYVGCYGYSFLSASKHVCRLFASKGWSAIANDDLTNIVFFMGNLVIGALSAYVATLLVKDQDKEALEMFKNPDAVIAFFAFFVGYATNNMFMSVMACAVTTVFVLWAEDPHGWQATRPEAYETLHSAWINIYPEEYNGGHGKQAGSRV